MRPYFIKLHPFAVVFCMVLVVCVIFMKYFPLYQLYYVQHDGFNNTSVLCGNAEKNVTNMSRASIKMPIVFLVVNFVYFYVVLIMVICLCGLYGRAVPSSLLDPFSKVRYPNDDDDNHTLQTTNSRQSTDDEKFLCNDDNNNYFSLNILHAPKSDDTNPPCLWTGDWNKYWNNKNDY